MTRALVLLALVSCSKKPAEPAASGIEPSAVQAEGGGGAMHVRLLALTRARDLIVAGDLAGARDRLQQIADDAVPSMAPAAWTPHLEDLRDAAATGAETGDVAGLSKAVALGAKACGDCHGETGGGPRWVGQPVPPPGEQMARHVWASDRMWEGLIGPSTERWEQAAAALDAEVDDSSALYAGLDLATASQASKLHQRVHELGEAGRRASLSADDRVELYAAFVGACAECHTVTGRGPR